jgi:hypothetical protein
MENQSHNKIQKDTDSNTFFRFQVYQGNQATDGQVKKTKSIGMAYLKSGQSIFSLRLWMFSSERYYLLPNKNDGSKYFVMTREPNKHPNARTKYFWNIVGSGAVNSVHGHIELEFDLLSRPVFVSIHPEASAHTSDLPSPESFEPAA